MYRLKSESLFFQFALVSDGWDPGDPETFIYMKGRKLPKKPARMMKNAIPVETWIFGHWDILGLEGGIPEKNSSLPIET